MGDRLRKLIKMGMMSSGGGFALPYSVDFTGLADGAIPARLTGATWAVSSGRAVNTPTLGAAVNLDPDFPTPNANWNLGGNWTIADGVASHASGATLDALSQLVLTAGTWYRFDWTITAYTQGQFICRFGGATNLGVARTAAATYVDTYRADNTTGAIRASTTAIGSVDDFTMKPITTTTLYSYLDMRRAYGEVNAIWEVAAGSQFGVMMFDNPANPLNVVMAYCDGNGYIKMDKRVNGTWSTVEATVAAAVTGKNLRLYRAAGGDVFQVYYGAAGSEVQIGTDQTITGMTGTYAGFFATSPAPKCMAFSAG